MPSYIKPSQVSQLHPIPSIRATHAYHTPPCATPTDLVLANNEGPVCIESIPPYLLQNLNRYPQNSELEKTIAEKFSIPPQQVIVTAGSDDAISRLLTATLSPGSEILIPDPSFEMISHYANIIGAKKIFIPWLSGAFPLDPYLDKITEKTRVICVVTPNNPTGGIASLDAIRQLATAAPHALIIVDHAYVEFADEDHTLSLRQYPNVVVLRTFSKAWGLAGLRVGYAIAPSPIIQWMRTVGGPYEVSRPALAIAKEALLKSHPQMSRYVEQAKRERNLLIQHLQTLGASPLPTQGNFVLSRFKNAEWVFDGLSGLGILVRRFPNNPTLKGYLRITCPGSESDFKRLIHGLKSTLAPQAILFDMDGVLVDVTESYDQTIIETAKSYGVQLNYNDIIKARASGDANNDWIITHRLITACGVNRTFDEVKSSFELIYQGNTAQEGLHTKEKLLTTHEWIARLSERIPLGIITGRPRNDATRLLARLNLQGFFSTVVTMEDAPQKPSPEPVKLALSRLGATHAWMIGDTPDDIRAARSANVVPIGIYAPKFHDAITKSALTKAGASRIIAHLNEIRDLLP